MSELKLVVENNAEAMPPLKPELPSTNPMDALNRRDIELIKKSLVSMNKNNAELRDTMIRLHQQNTRTPSKSFFVSLGVLWFVGFCVLTIVRPHLGDIVFHAPGAVSQR